MIYTHAFEQGWTRRTGVRSTIYIETCSITDYPDRPNPALIERQMRINCVLSQFDGFGGGTGWAFRPRRTAVLYGLLHVGQTRPLSATMRRNDGISGVLESTYCQLGGFGGGPRQRSYLKTRRGLTLDR